MKRRAPKKEKRIEFVADEELTDDLADYNVEYGNHGMSAVIRAILRKWLKGNAQGPYPLTEEEIQQETQRPSRRKRRE